MAKREFSLWSFLRNVLEQGCAIQLDYEAGNFASYEHYSARLDEAARERESQLTAEQAAKPQDYGAELASEINALPAKLREYVHDLETGPTMREAYGNDHLQACRLPS